MGAGITRTQYESGASVTAARGHLGTPERKPKTPEQLEKARARYPHYRDTIHVIAKDGDSTELVWVAGLSKSQRSMIARHWNAVGRYIDIRSNKERIPSPYKTRKLSSFQGTTVTDVVTGRVYELETRGDPLYELSLRKDLAFETLYQKVA
jgi:hypothetical protein